MAKKIEIRLIDNPSDNDHVYFFPVIPSEFYSNLTTITFKNTVVTGAVLIGATKLDTINNMVALLNGIYSLYPWATVTQVTDGVDILMTPDDITFTPVGTPIVGDITLTIVDIVAETFSRDNIILSRSPYNVSITPTVLFDSASMELRLYRGELDTDRPLLPNYSLSKSVIQAGQTKINFEIAKYLNDFCKSNIQTFGTGVQTTTVYDSVWAEATLTAYYLGADLGTVVKKFYGVDGFGYHTELYNPKLTKNVLSNITEHIIYRGSNYPLYFVSKDLNTITVDGNSIAFTLDDTINNQLISYINIGSYVTTQDTFTAIFEYDTVTETHTFIIKDECRFPLYNCFFKNKYGFWQSIPFNLRSKVTLDVEVSEYMPVISLFGQYSLQSHQNRQFNPDGKEKISLNTDYLPENYNTLFDELMLSEFVYLENNGQMLPVKRVTNSFSKKTRVFDRLIQYSLDFEYSFNKINRVV